MFFGEFECWFSFEWVFGLLFKGIYIDRVSRFLRYLIVWYGNFFWILYYRYYVRRLGYVDFLEEY